MLPPSRIPLEKVRNQIDPEIGEAKAAWRQAKWGATFATLTANSLLIGQFVVGAAITTSFFQKTFSPTYISLFGLVVVITTALRQLCFIPKSELK